MSAGRKKVVVAMSGGVDSSVAAAVLLGQGYDVMGVFMRLGTPPGLGDSADEACDPAGKPGKQGCCSVLDADDARRVAGMLGIPLYVLNFQDDFARVIDYFVGEYNAGRTPNPCVRCNDWLKFGKLRQYAHAAGAEFVASGHYARIGIDPATGSPALMRGVDHRKDQSYVLFGMPPDELARTLLPIGGMEKSEVRAVAAAAGLPVFNKPDSQEICFVPDQDYAGLVRRRTPEAFRPGDLVDSDGTKIGTHDGHQHFTIGQRKGVGVALGYPVYVTRIDASGNRVTLGGKASLSHWGLIAGQTNWLTRRFASPGQSIRCLAKIRYNHKAVPATATIDALGALRVMFDEPQVAVTPGQAVVLYDRDVVLGGGWIDASIPPTPSVEVGQSSDAQKAGEESAAALASSTANAAERPHGSGA